MAQSHVDLLGDLAEALLEVPEGCNPYFSIWVGSECHASADMGSKLQTGPTVAAALRKAISDHATPADWFAQAYERAMP